MQRTSVEVEVRDVSQVGDARRKVQRMAQLAQLDDEAVSDAAIIVTEMATNLIKHGGGGCIVARSEPGAVEICAVDTGAGMDVAASLRDGCSTRGTAGNGLGAIRRLARAFDAYSDSRGSVVWARLGAAEGALQLGAVCLPLGGESGCGDDWTCALSAQGGFVFLVDGLGHGPIAAAAAQAGTQGARDESPLAALSAAHGRMSGTRGGAGAYVRLDLAARTLTYASVGNIAVSLIAQGRSRGLPAQNGTLGLRSPLRIRETVVPLEGAVLLVMHSDGLATRWSLADYPGLAMRHAAVIAAVLWRDHRRGRDDASVMVLRW